MTSYGDFETKKQTNETGFDNFNSDFGSIPTSSRQPVVGSTDFL